MVTVNTLVHKVRLLIDTGSELSFINENIVHNLQLTRTKSNIEVYGIGGKLSTKTKGKIILKLQSLYRDEHLEIEAQILTSISSIIPSQDFQFNIATHNQVKRLNLADKQFNKARGIDIIIGADYYGNLIKPNIIKLNNSSLIAQLSIFGWLIIGSPTNTQLTDDSKSITFSSSSVHNDETNNAQCFHNRSITSEVELDELLKLFWLQEEPPLEATSHLSVEEQRCEEHFQNTHSRDTNGRYIVRIPLRESAKQLGQSYSTAHRCLQHTTRRLERDTNYKTLYTNFMAEYEQLDHMKQIPEHKLNNKPHYYLPHHGVLREQSTTTKLRVVFNGSSKTNSGKSINDITYPGQNLLLNIVDVLTWIRSFKYLFSTDITKMFRQIKIHEDDWDLQRILWLNNQEQEQHYHLTTVTYGTRAAPFLAVRTLLQLVEDEGQQYPLAVPSLLQGRYVDDIFGGGDTPEQLKEVATQLRSLCKAGGFPLAKWSSTLTEENKNEEHKIHFDNCNTRILGIFWSPMTDKFTFTTLEKITNKDHKCTKRLILSQIATIFDPLGFVSPVIIRAKIFMQELWLLKLGWDDNLPSTQTNQWYTIRDELTNLTRISIPRWFNTYQNTSIELHGFSDASQLAMAAVIYLTINTPSTGAKTTLICSKTKVAPLKKITIPRLELTAALLLAKLVDHFKKQLQFKITNIHLWTDSRVTLDWIKAPPARWKEFVCNRVSQIQQLTEHARWRHAPGTQNPADCASRGITSEHLENNELWWSGPPWLVKPENTWPKQSNTTSSSSLPEERPGLTLLATKQEIKEPWTLIEKHSSVTKLFKITALCLRFISTIRKNPIKMHEAIDQAKTFWIKSTQSIYFSQEIKTILDNKTLTSSHPLSKLTAFIDAQGILRVGGRLENTVLSYENKHQAILPRSARLTTLLIDYAHKSTLHGGTQLTLGHIRQHYWIIGGRASVKAHILRCVECARQRGIRAHQLMGQLPLSRVTPTRAFEHTGIDYAGPIILKNWKSRGAKTYKGWICAFVCMTTSAAHLELVTEYTTEAFLATYKRFTSRRGIPAHLYSDCGTNFIGAERELKILFTQYTKENQVLENKILENTTRWHFNPPGAPHMGGKWEALIKSTKYHLKRTIGESKMTYEEASTLLTQIEAILNSRPLEPLSDDPDDLQTLTPGHFLTGTSLMAIPEPCLIDLSTSRLSRWQFIQQITQQFWSQWSSQYLQRQQSISKWHHVNNKIQVGSLILISDERAPLCRWPLGRVTKLLPGTDGLVRVVELKTATTTLVRPIAKLIILPVNAE